MWDRMTVTSTRSMSVAIGAVVILIQRPVKARLSLPVKTSVLLIAIVVKRLHVEVIPAVNPKAPIVVLSISAVMDPIADRAPFPAVLALIALNIRLFYNHKAHIKFPTRAIDRQIREKMPTVLLIRVEMSTRLMEKCPFRFIGTRDQRINEILVVFAAIP